MNNRVCDDPQRQGPQWYKSSLQENLIRYERRVDVSQVKWLKRRSQAEGTPNTESLLWAITQNYMGLKDDRGGRAGSRQRGMVWCVAGRADRDLGLQSTAKPPKVLNNMTWSDTNFEKVTQGSNREVELLGYILIHIYVFVCMYIYTHTHIYIFIMNTIISIHINIYMCYRNLILCSCGC